MPTIYDNMDTTLLEGLKAPLDSAQRADFCVGYFNLRGWKLIAGAIDALPGQEGYPPCRLIVGMSVAVDRAVRNYYSHTEREPTNRVVNEEKRRFAKSLRAQLTYGIPTASDEAGLRKLARQLRDGKLSVSFFGAHPLHAKLYLVHREGRINPIISFVGSSNLTLSGMGGQGELNVDVLDKDAARKLADWFEDRWQDKWCLDITEELADLIEESWAGGPIKPYEIYIKTAHELAKEAIEGSADFKVPKVFNKIMLEFQKQAVTLAAERLSQHDGVIIGDVVGLGKTLVASAVAKIFQEDRGDSVLVICPPKLEKMWKDYLHTYTISGDTLSLGQTRKLSKMRRYRLVVIDESHNLRNRDSRRYGHVLDYLRENESRVVLLTATPYNKEFTDIGNQLRLFVEPNADLGIRPEDYIHSLGGASGFSREHSNTLITSLEAFEHSLAVDDWRELMRMYMVRRTRSHIQNNYAEYDKSRKQHYLSFDDNSRFYFPHRKPKCAKFSLDAADAQDQYALLYSPTVVSTISELKLPRYGIGEYLLPPERQAEIFPGGIGAEQQRILENLSRAGNRLVGFAKAGFFKRLESSGYAFLLSIKRHIVRNAVYLCGIDEAGKFPVGDILGSLVDEATEEEEQDIFAVDDDAEGIDLEHLLETGRSVYRKLSSDKGYKEKFDWIESSLFKKSLKKDLLADCRTLFSIIKIVPEWRAKGDRKLDALDKLCQQTHRSEKLLIFTQFKDTADYLHCELVRRGVDRIASVFGGIEDISSYVKRFSPTSNDEDARKIDELRILISTDTLSEGQNLQDAHIIVNFDLPWAIIRLIQRAGRVDRIGQKAREILCYCFLPEDGIERIIDLRSRLQTRIRENAELIGSDEQFFDDDEVDLRHIYEESISLDGQEDETDLISRAYDIWRQAVKDDLELKERIEALPDVVYSAKHASEESGIIAYVKTSNGQHTLARLDDAGSVVSQSQSKILDWLYCKPCEPLVPPAENHHELVAKAVYHVKENQVSLGGQLGGPRNIRRRIYDKIIGCLEESDSRDLKDAAELIYQFPLKETARDRLARQLRAQISDKDLMAMVLNMFSARDLCTVPKTGEPVEPQIICSMGLVKNGT